MKRLAILPCLFMLVPHLCTARTWYILPDSTGDAPTIHAGLDSASYGDTVLVAPGTYLVTDDPETSINPASGTCLRSEDGAEVTIIEFCDRGTAISLGDCEGAQVSGFTIRFGTGPDCHSPPVPTEGIFCWNCTDITVEDCVIENVSYGIYVEGHSSEWWKPVFSNNIIRSCGFGVGVFGVLDPGRPFFQDNIITECNYGAHIMDSSPNLSGNEVTYCRDFGLYYSGYCGGNCVSNVIAHNQGIGVYMYVSPPLAAPSFNGGWDLECANDFYDNGSFHISYNHSPGEGFVLAPLNYWGSRCPDSSSIFHGTVIYESWVDSTHTQALNSDDCPQATEPTTWGSIKEMFR